MKRSNAIIAAVVVVIAVIAAAAGGFLLMNPGSNPPSSDQGGGATDIRPSGPEGSVNSAVVNVGGTNESNASALPELQEEFNATMGNSGVPDTLAKVAVTNNRTDDITLKCRNFTANLDNGSSVRALNNNTVPIAPNATKFIVLGFITNGTNITSIKYDDGNISFTASWTGVVAQSLPSPVIRSAPNATLTAIDNLTFSALEAWKIDKGRYAPMALHFDNQSLVLALMTGTNNNTTAVDLKASDFWLDLGNGSWVQGEDRLNNNVPKTIRSNTTVPFLLGFRGAANNTPSAIYYWPGTGAQGEKIAIDLNRSTDAGPFVVLKGMWWQNMSSTGNASGNMTSSNMTPVLVQLQALGEGAGSLDPSSITAWTLHNGKLTGTQVESGSNETNESGKVVTMKFDLKQGDDLTLLTYKSGDSTRYVWLRSVQPVT